MLLVYERVSPWKRGPALASCVRAALAFRVICVAGSKLSLPEVCQKLAETVPAGSTSVCVV
jgi:hypothetical protein